jgi:hypothetical protein
VAYTQTLNFLINLFGNDHVYVRTFVDATELHEYSDDAKHPVYQGTAILRAVREDLERGYLSNINRLISAEVFTAFLAMARHLHETGYKDPAASLTGAVLEDGLRKIAEFYNLRVKARDDASSLSQRIADRGVYNRLKQKQLDVCIDVRN